MEEKNNESIEGEIIEGEVHEPKEDDYNETLDEDVKSLEEKQGGFSNFFSNFKSVLAEAGISGRQFFMLIGCFFIFLISLIVLIYFLYQIFSNNGQFTDDEPAIPPTEEIPIENISKNADSLIVGFYLGQTFFDSSMKSENALLSGAYLGQNLKGFQISDAFIQSLDVLKSVNALIALNIVEEVDSSQEKEKVFNNYLNEIKKSAEKMRALRLRLQGEMVDFRTEYEDATQQKNAKEVLFFEQIEVYASREAKTTLNEFIGWAEKQVRARADFKSRERVVALLEPRIILMENRIKALELNKEAIIKGIKIVPIEGSGIDLIDLPNLSQG